MGRRAASFSRDSDLTGLWSGEYWYGGAGQPTPFTAHFVDADGSLTGTTLEPNSFADPSLGELSATLRGSRGDLSVRFVKLYDPAPGVHQSPITYSGTVDANFTMIDGEWSIAGVHSGHFVLVRVSRGAQAEAIERAEEIVLQR
ncbi:MAG: hypothetical protein ABI740_11030 [Alphaproteobacteria bacterium]